MFKKVLALALASVMILGITGCSGKEETKVLKLSFNQTMENPEAKTIVDLSEKLMEATDGRYSIEVYPSEGLGNQKDSLAGVQNGSIDMAIVANPLVEGVNPDFGIIGTPYVYDSLDHQEAVFASGKLDELYATTEASGFTVLAAYNLGARCLYGTEFLTTPEELAGKKIRVMESDTMVNMINAMGGVGTPMAQGDVYSAIQTGMLDGAENNIITYVDLVQYEVAPYYTITNHLMVPDELIINTELLKGMSAEDQATLKKLAQESVTFMFDTAEALRTEYYDKAEELNFQVTEIDITPFQSTDAMKALIDANANKSDMSAKMYEAIQSLR